ncbi:uncharacterized protein BJ212DRAFT_1348415, partial [Suillus subaureus]
RFKYSRLYIYLALQRCHLCFDIFPLILAYIALDRTGSPDSRTHLRFLVIIHLHLCTHCKTQVIDHILHIGFPSIEPANKIGLDVDFL